MTTGQLDLFTDTVTVTICIGLKSERTYIASVGPFCGATDGPGKYWSHPPNTDRVIWHCGLHGFEDRPVTLEIRNANRES